jgi:K+ transporter
VTSSLPTLSLAALGVVFGDIGTSLLYTLKTVLGLTGANPDPTTTLGALSLVIWTPSSLRRSSTYRSQSGSTMMARVGFWH